MLKGIDVSEHQGKIDWKTVKNSGIQFAILRAGYGKNNIDKQFINNANGCTNVGMPFGLYWFSYAYTEDMARQEAKYCVAQAKKYKLSYPICYDLEYDTVRYAQNNGVTITKSLATKMVNAFCQEVEKNGYFAMNYSNQDFLLNKFDSSLLKRYALWYAWYNPVLNRECAIWQYSEKGRVNGITGNVDMNYSYMSDINNPSNPKPPSSNIYGNHSLIGELQQEINSQGFGQIAVDGIAGDATLNASPMVKKGARGGITKTIQKMLLNIGYPIGPYGVDGIFGDGTETAIKALQRDCNLIADGIVGRETWKALFRNLR
ncbi:GH25 family lysozyme [Clostridium sp. Marseille-Q2269]|uniref:GH25 family lysozyme n=1 Tax=Clostridium sp. Marseille-Q2269 TaxID=2942205 RepID=UPI0020734BDD|nr:GH25 family lysozyme [Clostridium sp. Marseille-Q2269]